MEDRETARMRKYGESKTTRIMMATVPHVISGLGLRKFQADGFLLTRVYNWRVTATASLSHSTSSQFILLKSILILFCCSKCVIWLCRWEMLVFICRFHAVCIQRISKKKLALYVCLHQQWYGGL